MAAESRLERECRSYVEVALHGKLVKVHSPSNNGWPDRILLLPGCPVVFIEFKAPNKPLKRNQLRWKIWLEGHGFIHWTIDCWADFISAIDAWEKEHAKRR